jgi:hypothetical protein
MWHSINTVQENRVCLWYVLQSKKQSKNRKGAVNHSHILQWFNIRGSSKKFGEWCQKSNITEDTNKLTLLAFKIIAILHNTLLATLIKLLETVSKGLFRNLSRNRYHTFLDCRHVCKTCAFHDALQAGKQNQVHRTPLIWRLLNREDWMLFDLSKHTSANRATYKTRCLTVLLSVVTEENNGHGQGSGWRWNLERTRDG